MPTFHYAGVNALGEPVSGSIKAPSEMVARDSLASRDQVHVSSIRPSFLSREWGSGKPKPASVLLFTRMTASLLRSLTLQESLEVTRDDLGDPRMERVLWDVSVHVRRGRSLADTLAEHPAVFDPVYVAAVRAGEQANLQDVMRMLAESRKRSQETRRKVVKGLAYPATILGVGTVVSILILYVVVPRFAKAVADAGAEAPLIMRIMLGASHVLTVAGPAMLLGGLLLGWIGVRAYRTREGLRTRVDGAMLRIPILGTLLSQAALAAWARLFAILYSSGSPVAAAVEMAAQTIGNRKLRAQLGAVSRGHGHGRPLWQEMQLAGIAPIASKLVRVGEESGRLGEMLGELAEYYEEETSYSVDKLTSRLEPLAIIVIMVPVALLVGGVYALMTASMQAVTGG
ncbi:MAG TPA: type II secretion system F family protein [Longimicrobiaceae bacterium]|nr:type II secretion system F family protein [Longimicrobiaceae bacterium]